MRTQHPIGCIYAIHIYEVVHIPAYNTFIYQGPQKSSARFFCLPVQFPEITEGGATTENYKYLTVEQALADLNKFTSFYKQTVPGTAAVPWVIFGGSYSGGLSSWYRSTYPSATVGGLSSSGVVNTIIDFYQFDQQVSICC